MENNLELQKELFNQIEAELFYCNDSTTPLICKNFNNPDTKNQLIKTIAQTCIEGKIQISQAIVEVERLYSPNDID